MLTDNQRKQLLAVGLNPDAFNSAGASVASPRSNSGVGILRNPFQTPMQLVFNGTIPAASTKTYFHIDDACGLAGVYGQVSEAATAGILFIPSGGLTAAVLKEYLKTHALIIGGYNFESTDASLLSNNLRAIYSTLDGNISSKQMFSAQTVSNMQQNPNLLNVDQAFVYTNDCALKIPVTADATDAIVYTFTFKIKGAVPYGQLDAFLEEAKIIERSKMSC